jgi:tetratricopeptide (TPR) repeat protein
VRLQELALALVLAGCSNDAPPAPLAGGAVVQPAVESARAKPTESTRRSPLTQEELPTTDGQIAAGNFLAQIESVEKGFARTRDPTHLGSLIQLLTTRGQFFGRLADYDRAAELAVELVQLRPNDAQSYLTRASTRSTLHRFAEALADLDKAAQLGARGERVEAPRATILLALGREDDALALRKQLADARADISSLGLLAAVHAERGDTDEAERLFIEAQYHYRDVSPFVVSWLYFQHGLMEQRLGRLSTARDLFQAAHDRLPAYAPAGSHLAAVLALTGARETALAILRPLVESSDDPEYGGQLAQLLVDAGLKEESRSVLSTAMRRYDELVKRHPEAFADHAARFWLGPGGDAKRALGLAQRNLSERKTRDAYQLVVECAVAARAFPLACTAAEAGLALPRPSPSLRLAASRAFEGCGKRERAAAELKQLTP